MTLVRKTIWSDGMFLRPQHFQQHDRYVERLVEQRCASLRSYDWGFSHLALDEGQLALGKVALTEARGLFPDGTPFQIPDDVEPPTPLDVPDSARDAKVVLALPLRQPGMRDVALNGDNPGLARYVSDELDVPDTVSGGRNDSAVPLEVGRLSVELLLQKGEEGAYATLGACRIRERRADNQVELDSHFIPPILDARASKPLRGYLQEVIGHLRQKGDTLAGRVSASGRGGTAEIVDFLFLMVVNRFEPLFVHLGDAQGVHPETCYQAMAQLAGELATVTRAERRPIPHVVYRHDDLDTTFEPLIAELRRSIQWFDQPRALPIPLKSHPKFSIWAGTIDDRSLVGSASFVLTARADVPAQRLVGSFPNVVTVGPEQQISKLVNSRLKGIELRPLASAPRQLPFYAGAAYFELERGSELWKSLEVSGSLAFHIGDKFPELELELWAIRG